MQSAGQTPQQQSFSPQLQAAQQQQFMGNLQQQQQQQQQQLRNANKSALQGQAPSQAPTPLPVRPTPQSQPTAQAGVASQAATPGFRASQPTPSQTSRTGSALQQRAPSRQASSTPQSQFQPPLPLESRHPSATTSEKPLPQQPGSGTAKSPSVAATPAQNNGTVTARSASPVATTTDSATTGRSGTPQQQSRSRSGSSLNLAGITRQSVPSLPISSSINVKQPTITTFNSINDTRPSLTGGAANPMSILLDTPAITKLPTFDIEGDTGVIDSSTSGRVLNKRKLGDLINTIGVDEGDGKTSIDGNVEEFLLDLADEFIHSVTSFACRLAKHRKVDSIEARDVQLHLDKNWNIKIPGYAMDEIRNTRKIQPSNSYSQKVQGVEVSKAVNDDNA